MRQAAAPIFASLMALSVAGAARAADSPAGPVFNIMGPSKCATWPKRGSIESPGKAVALNWVLGFVSGEAERSDPRLFDLLDPDQVAGWIDTHCQTHPDDTLPAAARALTAELEGRLGPRPPPMFVPRATATTEVSPPPARKSAPRKPAATPRRKAKP